MITSNHREGHLTVEHIHQSLELSIRGGEIGKRSRQRRNGLDARGGEVLRLSGSRLIDDFGEVRFGPFEIGPIVAIWAADDPVFAGGALHHELNRRRSTHGPGRRLDVEHFDP